MNENTPRHSARWSTRREAWRNLNHDARRTEAFSGLSALWWTFLLTVPGNLFATNRAFLGLAQHGQPAAWAFFTGAVGALWLLSLPLGHPLLRFASSLSGFFVWIYIAYCVSITSPLWHHLVPVNTGLGIYGLLSAFCAWSMCDQAGFVVFDLANAVHRLQRRKRGGA